MRKHRVPALIAGCLLLFSLFMPGALGEEVQGELTRPGIPFQASYPPPQLQAGISPTTGLPWAGEAYTPVMLVLDNTPAAYPHWGVTEADVVYQVPNAGAGATKLIALYANAFPEQAGGSRSARPPFVDVAREWGAAFAYAGHADLAKGDKANVQERIRNAGMFQNILAFNLQNFNKYSERVKGYSSPHNLSVHIRTIRDLAVQNGAVFPVPRPFLFSDALPTQGRAVSAFTVAHHGEEVRRKGGNEASFSTFVYQPEANAYWREHTKGWDVDKDDPNTPLAFANVIIQRVKFSYSGGYVLVNDFFGTGAADIFTGGRYIKGGWFKQDLVSRSVFVDEQGQEIALQRGRTFIILTNDVSQLTITGQ